MKDAEHAAAEQIKTVRWENDRLQQHITTLEHQVADKDQRIADLQAQLEAAQAEAKAVQQAPASDDAEGALRLATDLEERLVAEQKRADGLAQTMWDLTAATVAP